jgi:hypothetical protein
MKVINGDFKKKESKLKAADMLEDLRKSLGNFEDEHPDVAVESVCIIFIEDREFVLASNGQHPDTVNMLLDIAKYHVIMGNAHHEESYDGPKH